MNCTLAIHRGGHRDTLAEEMIIMDVIFDRAYEKEMMNALPGGFGAESSENWNEMHTSLSRVRRLYEKGILSEIEAAMQMNSTITAAIHKHIMACGSFAQTRAGIA